MLSQFVIFQSSCCNYDPTRKPPLEAASVSCGAAARRVMDRREEISMDRRDLQGEGAGMMIEQVYRGATNFLSASMPDSRRFK